MSKAFKDNGRPPGSPNKKSNYARSEYLNLRITEGCQHTIAALITECNYQSSADVVHDAIQQLAYKKLHKKIHKQWVEKIQ